MLRLFKYLRQSKRAVAAIFILLILQAWCDLSLPQYTSDIVDIGIQQSGIENAVPVRMRQSTLDALKLFLTDEQAALADASYVSDGDGIVRLNTDDAQTIETLDTAFQAPMAVLAGLADDPDAQARFPRRHSRASSAVNSSTILSVRLLRSWASRAIL